MVLLTLNATDEFLTKYWPKRPFVVQADSAQWPAALRGEELASVQNLARRYRGSLRFTPVAFIKRFWFATLAPQARVGEVSRQLSNRSSVPESGK